MGSSISSNGAPANIASKNFGITRLEYLQEMRFDLAFNLGMPLIEFLDTLEPDELFFESGEVVVILQCLNHVVGEIPDAMFGLACGATNSFGEKLTLGGMRRRRLIGLAADGALEHFLGISLHPSLNRALGFAAWAVDERRDPAEIDVPGRCQLDV